MRRGVLIHHYGISAEVPVVGFAGRVCIRWSERYSLVDGKRLAD